MAQHYEVLDFKKGTFKDDNQNWWCNMALKGIGEPVSIAVKDPTQFHTGMTLYGTIETKVSRSGKDYLRFKREKEPEQPASSREPAKSSWQPRDDESIRAQFAIKTAAQIGGVEDVTDLDKIIAHLAGIEKAARELYAMVDRVKGSTDAKRAVDEVFDVSETINLNDVPY